MSLVKMTPALIAALLVPAALAQNCRIDNAEESDLGPRKAVSGTCSNNGLPIRCTYEDRRIIDCGGPNGSYSGTDLAVLIVSACGCDD